MQCKYCGVEIKPYQPGTVLVEGLGPNCFGLDVAADSFVAHEECYKQDVEDYVTADEVLKEVEDADL